MAAGAFARRRRKEIQRGDGFEVAALLVQRARNGARVRLAVAEAQAVHGLDQVLVARRAVEQAQECFVLRGRGCGDVQQVGRRRKISRCSRRAPRAPCGSPACRAGGKCPRAAPPRPATRACATRACATPDRRWTAAPPSPATRLRPAGAACPCGIILYGFRSGTRCTRPELPAADPAHQEGADRHAIGADPQGARHRSRRGQGFPDLFQADRARAAVPRRGEQGIHLLHEEEVKRAYLACLLFLIPAVHGQATFNVKILTPETALKAAQAALKKCRDSGYQATAAVGGGLMIEAGGSLLGAIGVSGAPGGREDDACAAAGIAAIREDIEL